MGILGGNLGTIRVCMGVWSRGINCFRLADKAILDFYLAFDFTIANTCFRKLENIILLVQIVQTQEGSELSM